MFNIFNYQIYDSCGNPFKYDNKLSCKDLKDAEDKKVLKRGDKVMLTGFGVGFSWGSCLLEW